MYFKKLAYIKTTLDALKKTNTSLYELQREFKDHDASVYIKNKLCTNLQKEKQLFSELKFFTYLYETYVLRIIELIEYEKKQVVTHIHKLNQHPEILKYLLKNIDKKEQLFKATLNKV